MGFADEWGNCLHTMGLPTPTEAWDSLQEAVEKLHEIDTALGGLSLAEAAEQLQLMAVTLEVGAEAGAVGVSWWVGNAIGCIITAAVGNKIVDAIDWLVQSELWVWAQFKTNEVNYTLPSFEGLGVAETTTTRSSSTAQEDPPPHPVIDQGSGEAEWVRYLQRLLVENYGYQIETDGAFGPATAVAVSDFKQQHNLGSSTEVDQYTWRALETAPSPVAPGDPPPT
jgi:Putative peptidoglycan binding domain